MRSRLALMLALVVVVGTVASLTAVSALASDQTVLAQAPDSPDEDEPLVGEDDAQQGDDDGESEPGAETGVEEGQTETAEEETGPVWTYQMSRISIVLFLLLALGIGGAYYNFVVKRQKEGV